MATALPNSPLCGRHRLCFTPGTSGRPWFEPVLWPGEIVMAQISRRQILQAMAATAGAGPLVAIEAGAQGRPVVNLQLGWLLSGNQIGEVCAKAMGFYEQEGIELKFQAGGPNIDGVAVVAAGRFEIGQVASRPPLMLPASQDIPGAWFAARAQADPYTFFSSTKKAVWEPRDMVGE